MPQGLGRCCEYCCEFGATSRRPLGREISRTFLVKGSAQQPECNSMRRGRGWAEPEIWFRILHVGLGPKGAFENGNIGTCTRRVPADGVVGAVPPRLRDCKPPKQPRTPSVVEPLRVARPP